MNRRNNINRKWKLSALADGCIGIETLADYYCLVVDFVLVNRYQIPGEREMKYIMSHGDDELENHVSSKPL